MCVLSSPKLSAFMAEPRQPPRPLQIASHPHNNSLVVLVHGIMSGRYAAWEDAIDMIQDIYSLGASTSTFASYDYYAFGYESGFVHQPPIDQCFDRLRSLVSRERYDSIVLVGHSQGGVVAKLFIINELLAGRGKELKVDVVITLDTPHKGPKLWFYPLVVAGGIWKRLPLVNRWPLFRQLAELGRGSRNLKRLRENWNDDRILTTQCEPESKRRHIRSYAVVGTRLPFVPSKSVVSNRSAEGFAIDHLIELPTGGKVAWSIGHGVQAMREYRYQIEQILSAHDYENIRGVERELATASNALLEAELSDCPPSALACEVQCWRRRVAQGFPRRPLRRLPMIEALRKFIKRRLENP